MPADDALTFCEFFAGIGLVREALEPAGWTCTYANDIDAKKLAHYAARFGPGHTHCADVWDTAAVVARIPGRPTLATASFPCIDLSLAGHWRGLGGRHSSAFFGFVRVLETLGDNRPPLVLVENVTGFLTSQGGRDFAVAAQALAALGYWLDAVVLDARHFVPQSRPRVFVIGSLGEPPPFVAAQSPGAWFDDGWRDALAVRPVALLPARLRDLMAAIELPTGWMALPLPAPPKGRTDVAGVIDLDDGQQWWDAAAVAKHEAMFHAAHAELIRASMTTGRRFVGTAYRRKRAGGTRAEVRFDGIAGCLRTPKGGSARQIVVVVDEGRLKMRWMSPREYARLQGAPDYPLALTAVQSLHGFGDAVCVPAVRWLDRHALRPLARGATAVAATPARRPPRLPATG